MGNISRLRGGACVVHHGALRAGLVRPPKAANWNSCAEYVAAHLQEQLLEIVGLRHALHFVPMAFDGGRAHALCPVCFLHGRGQQRVESFLPEDGDLDGQDWFRCTGCAETFAITQHAPAAEPVCYDEMDLPSRKAASLD